MEEGNVDGAEEDNEIDVGTGDVAGKDSKDGEDPEDAAKDNSGPGSDTPRYYGISRSATPLDINWPAAMRELGQLCIEAVGPRWIPFTYVMIFSRNSGASDLSADQQRYRAYRLQIALIQAWIQLRCSILDEDGMSPSQSILFSQNWYSRPADRGLKEIPMPIKGCCNLMDKNSYFEAISSSQTEVDLADVAPPFEHGSTALPPSSEAQPFFPGDMAQLPSSFGMARPPLPLSMAQPSSSLDVVRPSSSLDVARPSQQNSTCPVCEKLLGILAFWINTR